MNGKLKEIDYHQAINFLLPRHYSGRKPVVSKAFGLYSANELVAVCTFGKPASPQLCDNICGKKYSSNVYELNRLCRIEEWKYPLSEFIGKCLREISKYNWIIVSYSDTGMHHNGYIYQACNFIYTGKTAKRTDKYTLGNKHSRHYSNEQQGNFRKLRTSKNRYVYFCTNNKKLKKEWEQNLKYKICEYPKEKNINYKLGEFQKPILINIKEME